MPRPRIALMRINRLSSTLVLGLAASPFHTRAVPDPRAAGIVFLFHGSQKLLTPNRFGAAGVETPGNNRSSSGRGRLGCGRGVGRVPGVITPGDNRWPSGRGRGGEEKLRRSFFQALKRLATSVRPLREDGWGAGGAWAGFQALKRLATIARPPGAEEEGKRS